MLNKFSGNIDTDSKSLCCEISSLFNGSIYESEESRCNLLLNMMKYFVKSYNMSDVKFDNSREENTTYSYIYSDASASPKAVLGGAGVIVVDGSETHSFNYHFNNFGESFRSIQHYETIAAILGIRYCVEVLKLKDVVVVSDNITTIDFINQTNTGNLKDLYHDYHMLIYSSKYTGVSISASHVKGHSGDKYNTEADRLAKQGRLTNKYNIKYGNIFNKQVNFNKYEVT